MSFSDRPDDVSPGGAAADRPFTAIAHDRLSELGSGGLFTSTLSVSEFALIAQMGPQPLGTVQGTSVHQIPWQQLPDEAQYGQSDLFCRLDGVMLAWRDARDHAFGRLRDEARRLGADLVAGVQLQRGERDWARRSVDFNVIGTALRMPSDDPGSAGDGPDPVLSGLSTQDVWKLRCAGWTPAGLLATTAAYFISQGNWTRWQRRRSVLQSQERWEYSDGFSAARHDAVDDMKRQARAVRADGIVAMSLDYVVEPGSFRVQTTTVASTSSSYGTLLLGEATPTGRRDRRDGVAVSFHSIGTAIRRLPETAARPPRVATVPRLGVDR